MNKIEKKFPSTRYQGSKLKLISWIDDEIKDIDFETVLDVFGGTGAVSYLFKQKGKKVCYNDLLKFNYFIGKALIENNTETLNEVDIDNILKIKRKKYPTFIEDNFEDIYFTTAENRWLDIVVTNIKNMKNEYKQSIAYFALFQSCMIKRPYNLFHRKNLYIRMAEVNRTFGNKKTWDTPFETHFRKFISQANNSIIDNKKKNKAINKDVSNLKKTNYDLIYIDPPYISEKGGNVDYLDFYHFLEGLADYDNWYKRIDFASKNKKMKIFKKNNWSDKDKILSSFINLFEKYKKSIIIISYRNDGIPKISELKKELIKLGKKVSIHRIDYKYALSKKELKEVLIIAE